MAVKNSKPSIAIIGAKGLPATGGAATSIELILDELKSNYNIYVYSISSHTSFNGFWNGFTQIVIAKSKIRYLNTLKYYFVSVIHSLLKGNYDLIHVNHLAFGFFVPILKVKYKVIGTDHGLSWLYQAGKGNKWNVLELYIFKLSKYFFVKYVDTFITVSREYLNHYNRIRENIVVINNGVKIDPEANTINSIKDNDIIFAAGRIIELKGCHLLLLALLEIGYNGKVKIIGDLSHSINYKKRILELAKTLNIDFLPLIKEKSVLMTHIRKSKLFIFPSLSEGMSNMLLEVVSQKTPIIASDIPENKSAFTNEEILYFKSNDIHDLAEKIKFALNNPEKMSEYANSAYLHVQKEYDIKLISKKYDIEYKKLIGA